VKPRGDTAPLEEVSPERAAAILRERARVLARPTAQTGATERMIEVATFRLGEERYAIEACYVLEVVRLVESTVVPGLPDFFLGVTNRRGEILAVVDLARFLGIEGGTASDSSRVIVLGRGEAELGIVADEVNEITTLAESALHAPSTVLGGSQRPYFRAVTGDALIVLDGAALLADERLYVDERDERALRPATRVK
jgi:purine-binding chemotaxis protein CheW